MDLVRKIKLYHYRIQKYFKNRKFRQEVAKEKAKRYLYNKPVQNWANFFDFYKNQKKFSNYINTFSNNIKLYKYLITWIWVLLIILCSYIIVVSPYFRISPSKLIIERLDTITDVNIAYKSIEDVYWQSIFLIDKNELKKSLLNYQKNIKNTSIIRLFPNWLKIIIESYSPQFFTQFAGIDKKYIVTSNWVLIYEKNIDKILYNLEIVDSNLIEAWFFDYKEWVPEKSMNQIIYTRDLFKQIFTWRNISKFVYFKLENELHINLETWTKIIVELWDNIQSELAMLKYYNDNNSDILSSWNISYVDVRIPNKIYACKEKTNCTKNLARIYSSYYKK